MEEHFLLCENMYYRYCDRRNETAIILFRNRSNQQYRCLGGSLRSLFEDSRGLLQFTDAKHLHSQKFHLQPHTCYVQGIRSGLLFGKHFYDNAMLLDSNVVTPKRWQRTDAVDRFYLSDLIKAGIFDVTAWKVHLLTSLVCENANKEQCCVELFTCQLIATALQQDLVRQAFEQPLEFTSVRQERSDFKDGLYTLVAVKEHS